LPQIARARLAIDLAILAGDVTKRCEPMSSSSLLLPLGQAEGSARRHDFQESRRRVIAIGKLGTMTIMSNLAFDSRYQSDSGTTLMTWACVYS
jgi:hypothetical protein